MTEGRNAGIDVLYDDRRDLRGGSKFITNDLLGMWGLDLSYGLLKLSPILNWFFRKAYLVQSFKMLSTTMNFEGLFRSDSKQISYPLCWKTKAYLIKFL